MAKIQGISKVVVSILMGWLLLVFLITCVWTFFDGRYSKFCENKDLIVSNYDLMPIPKNVQSEVLKYVDGKNKNSITYDTFNYHTKTLSISNFNSFIKRFSHALLFNFSFDIQDYYDCDVKFTSKTAELKGDCEVKNFISDDKYISEITDEVSKEVYTLSQEKSFALLDGKVNLHMVYDNSSVDNNKIKSYRILESQLIE